MDQNTQYCKDINSSKLFFQCNVTPNKNPSGLFVEPDNLNLLFTTKRKGQANQYNSEKQGHRNTDGQTNREVVKNRAQKQAIHTWHSIKVALGIGRKKMDHSVWYGNKQSYEGKKKKNGTRPPTSDDTQKINCWWIKDPNEKGS